jgi:kinesin family protein 2/24
MEDKSGQVQFQGLVEHQARSTDELMKLMEIGFGLRTTMSTVNNDESSRSHAICQISLKNSEGTRFGRLILVDLAVEII